MPMRTLCRLVPLGLAMALHGLYDFFLLAFDATLPASGIILLIWVALQKGHRPLIAT